MSLRFTKNFGTILCQAYGGDGNVTGPYNKLRGPADWLATQSIDSRVETDNTEPDPDDDFYFVRTIDGNYLPLLRQNSNNNVQGWDCAATLAPSALLPFNMQAVGETYLPTHLNASSGPYYGYGRSVYGILFGNGSLDINDAFDAYNIDSPIDCSQMLAAGADYRPINAIHYEATTDKYSQQIKWNLYNLSNSDFSFTEVGIFATLDYFSDRTLLTEVYKSEVNDTWYNRTVYGHAAENKALVTMIAYEAFDETITLHAGDILQVIITQGAAGLDWSIRPNNGDHAEENLAGEAPENQTVTPTQPEIDSETEDIEDVDIKALVARAEALIGKCGYTQNVDNPNLPTRNGSISDGKTWYDCSSFCFDMWRQSGVILSDSWQSGQNMPNTEALGKFAIKHGLTVTKNSIGVGDIILTARRNSDGSWAYPSKWNHINHAKLYVGEREHNGTRYNVIEMVGSGKDAIRSYYNLNDATFVCQFVIDPTLLQ